MPETLPKRSGLRSGYCNFFWSFRTAFFNRLGQLLKKVLIAGFHLLEDLPDFNQPFEFSLSGNLVNQRYSPETTSFLSNTNLLQWRIFKSVSRKELISKYYLTMPTLSNAISVFGMLRSELSKANYIIQLQQFTWIDLGSYSF